MSESNFGNTINRRLGDALLALLDEGEIVQLTHSSFEEMVLRINNDESENFTVTYPIGYRADKTTLHGTRDYTKDKIVEKIALLANEKLAINGIYQLVTIIEALLGDLIRLVILKYPKKIGPKRSIKSSEVMNCQSIEALHLYTANTILNELFYKSPKEFAEESKRLLSISLLECPFYHKYIEMKASRDIYIHNNGIANDTYLIKASTHARAKLHEKLPVDTVYFMENYEACIQLIEWMEQELNEKWPSSNYENRKKTENEQLSS